MSRNKRWTLYPKFDEHHQRSLEHWLRRGPSYNRWEQKGRVVFLMFDSYIAGSIKLWSYDQIDAVLPLLAKHKREEVAAP
ncbi:MAG: hypothetical protein KDB94_06115 [Acidobacteria bacterium]|nr:hypothetical protein [Acidobacteriota bacterium]